MSSRDALSVAREVLSQYFSPPLASTLLTITLRRDQLVVDQVGTTSALRLADALERTLPAYLGEPDKRRACASELKRSLGGVEMATRTSGHIAAPGVELPILREDDLHELNDLLRDRLREVGFSALDQTKFLTAASELVRNIIQYAKSGHVRVARILREANQRAGLELTASDNGRGILGSRSESMSDSVPTPRTEHEVGSFVRVLPGESVSGDVAVSARTKGGHLVALIDGLGHGEGAAEVAEHAARVFQENAEMPLGELFALTHRELRGTRGAVASAASFDGVASTLEFAGVGNVAVKLLPREDGDTSRDTLLVRPGVLGSAFRSVTGQRVAFEEGDVLVLHSDGVRSRFDALAVRLIGARAAAEDVVVMAGKNSDDASCIVVRGVAAATRGDVAPSAPGTPQRRVPIRVSGDAQVAAYETRQMAAELGMPARSQWEAGIAAAELASNVLKYGNEGVLTLRLLRGEVSELIVEVSDRGGGFGTQSPDRGAQPISSRGGLGVGLASVRRLMGELEIQSFPRRGTRLIARKRFTR